MNHVALRFPINSYGRLVTFQWATRLGSPVNTYEWEFGHGVTVDAAGNVFTTGSLANEANGILIEPGDDAGLADAMCSLANHPVRRQQLGAAGRVHALRFSWVAAAHALERIYMAQLDQKVQHLLVWLCRISIARGRLATRS